MTDVVVWQVQVRQIYAVIQVLDLLHTIVLQEEALQLSQMAETGFTNSLLRFCPLKVVIYCHLLSFWIGPTVKKKSATTDVFTLV